MDKKSWIWLSGTALVLALFAGGGYLYLKSQHIPLDLIIPGAPPKESPRSTEDPELTVEVVVEGLDKPWDAGFLPGGTLIYPERSKGISTYKDGQKRLLLSPADLYARGEGGMLGLTVDPKFEENRFIYQCLNVSVSEVKLIRLKLGETLTGIEQRKDIVTGLPAIPSGRHSGCRPKFGPDDVLWVGTGDAATGTNAQDPSSLGGKVLRVDREGGPVSGNLGAPFDSRIYSYGHRNVQGIAFNKEGSKIAGYSLEHGPDRDDEANELVAGNFGWDPAGGTYNESVPMTDIRKYPEAIVEVWKSGTSTTAPSGAEVFKGRQWKGWEDALVFANLKGSHLRILIFDEGGKVIREIVRLNDRGRLRSAVLGPDGNLYVTTDNGGESDLILKITPS